MNAECSVIKLMTLSSDNNLVWQIEINDNF